MNEKKRKEQKNNKHYLKIKSKIHPDIYHTLIINLHCYEKMPTENKILSPKFKNQNKNNK